MPAVGLFPSQGHCPAPADHEAKKTPANRSAEIRLALSLAKLDRSMSADDAQIEKYMQQVGTFAGVTRPKIRRRISNIFGSRTPSQSALVKLARKPCRKQSMS